MATCEAFSWVRTWPAVVPPTSRTTRSQTTLNWRHTRKIRRAKKVRGLPLVLFYLIVHGVEIPRHICCIKCLLLSGKVLYFQIRWDIPCTHNSLCLHFILCCNFDFFSVVYKVLMVITILPANASTKLQQKSLECFFFCNWSLFDVVTSFR